MALGQVGDGHPLEDRPDGHVHVPPELLEPALGVLEAGVIARVQAGHGVHRSLDRVHDGFFVLDNHCRFTTLNRKAAELAPHRPEALLGKQIWTAFPGTVGSIVWREFRRAMDEGVPVCFPYYSACLGRCYEVNAYPSEEGLAVFFHDVTDERSACEAREALERGVAFRSDVTAVLGNVDAPLDTVLQGCAEAVVRHTDAAFARIWTLNAQAQMLELQASAGLYTHVDGPHARIPLGAFKIGLNL